MTEEILMEFNAYIKTSYINSLFRQSNIVLTNRSIFIRNKYEIPLSKIKKIELIMEGNGYDITLKFTSSSLGGYVKIRSGFNPGNTKNLFKKLRILIPDCEYEIKRNRFGELSGIILYIIVVFSGYLAIKRIEGDFLTKLPIILILMFASLIVFLRFAPLNLELEILTEKKSERIIGIVTVVFFIFLIVLIIIYRFIL